ncbi:MAG: DoxX family membrane protein [Bacteroidota bacterium]
MEIINQYHETAAVFIARVFLGCLFFFQGFDAVFQVKLKNVVETYRAAFASKGIPLSLLILASWFTCYTELIGGLLLILGLFKYAALYLLGLNLIVASVGFGIHTAMWDTRHVVPRLLLLLFLLVVPQDWDAWSIDHSVR